ncbi:hypothetical protein HNQ39_004523 [Armatimonas rosea]|uniref:Uncharacterized protein n=1 Tax=Armatimonas rosea TaxID=685828 RepID=A0A7W9STS1_ARMRO|nr:hypothetical protein [Armatimonas rosea]
MLSPTNLRIVPALCLSTKLTRVQKDKTGNLLPLPYSKCGVRNPTVPPLGKKEAAVLWVTYKGFA